MASIDISGGGIANGGLAGNGLPQNKVPQVLDEVAEQLKPLFIQFIKTYIPPPTTSPSATDGAFVTGTGSGTGTGAAPTPLYLTAIKKMAENDRMTLHIDFNHLGSHAYETMEVIGEHYLRLEPYLEDAVRSIVAEYAPQHPALKRAWPFHVAFYNMPLHSTIRDLKTDKIGQLMQISGTVTRTSAVRPELSLATFRCQDCKTVNASIQQQFKYTEPTKCINTVCENRTRWTLDPNLSAFQDWQLVRIQENSADIPPGSMPRSMKIILRHENVELAKPGDKCIFTGCLIVVPDISQLAGGRGEGQKYAAKGSGGRGGLGGGGSDEANTGVGGLKELGVRDLTYSLCFMACSVRTTHSTFGALSGGANGAANNGKQDTSVPVPLPFMDAAGNEVEDLDSSASFTDYEKHRVMEIKSKSKLYSRLVGSVAPNIFGHDEIKRGILLMLLGGVHKKTRDGQNLRGDINVCIVGDPSTSKSQFLKYVCRFLPRAVYTSGKASSAAGLTASITRDVETGEFTIEAGALMLADNGICCIDEFDKMELTDQVAIHEAMEQQTISIAKAGIQATLNARTSILAAANPIKGRYDPARTLKQNVDISAPIMSRFDLFFVVLDEVEPSVDFGIARHILDVHLGQQPSHGGARPDFTLEDLQLYIRYARTIKPKITEEARRAFVENYCELRTADSTGGASKSAYRITVRQLESMIRLSEARARLDLSDVVLAEHVTEAARLLKKSIVHVETKDIPLETADGDDDLAQLDEEMANIDEAILNGGRRGDDDDDDNQQPPRGGAPGGSSRRGGDRDRRDRRGGSDRRERDADGDQEMADASGAEGAPRSAAASKQQEREKPKQELKLSFNEYQRITYALTSLLRRQEAAHPDRPTLSWAELVQRYILEAFPVPSEDQESSGAAEGHTMEDLAEATRLVELVIHRLIKIDHILLLVGKSSSDKNKRALKVHPNFTPDNLGETIASRADIASQQQLQARESAAAARAVASAAHGGAGSRESGLDDVDMAAVQAKDDELAQARQLLQASKRYSEREALEREPGHEASPPATPHTPRQAKGTARGGIPTSGGSAASSSSSRKSPSSRLARVQLADTPVSTPGKQAAKSTSTTPARSLRSARK